MYKLMTKGIDILPYCNNLSWSSDVDTLGTQITFDSDKDLLEGQVVSLFETDTEKIRGIVIKKTINKFTFNYTVQDYSFYLKNKMIKQFNKLNATECIKSIISGAYLQGSICDIPTQITQIYKDKSLDEIITDILEQATNDQGIEYVKEINGNRLDVYRLYDMKIKPNILIGDFKVDSSIEEMKNSIQVVSDEENNVGIVASAEDSTKFSWYGKLSDILSISADDAAKAKNIALNKLAELNCIKRSTSIPLVVLDEKVDIKANRVMYIKKGPLDGYYKIKSASHTLADGMHKCNIEIEYDISHNVVTNVTFNPGVFTEASTSASSTSSSGSGKGADIITFAKKYLGLPYVWGGTTTKGFDCSGFTQYCYKQVAGIDITRTTYTQINSGTVIGQSSAKAGDLFFPHSGHVGLYMGDGNVIHSPKTGDVIKISPVWSGASGYPKFVRVKGM